MNPINLFESYNSMYDPDMILTEEYESIDNISDEELLAILEEVIEEEGYTIDESIEYIEEITKAGAQWEVEYRKRRLKKAAAKAKDLAGKVGSAAKRVAKKGYEAAKGEVKKRGLKDAAKSLLAKGLRKGAALARKAASKVEPTKEKPKAEAPKAKSPSGTYRNVGAGKKEKAGGEMKAEPKSASEPNQERIKKAREKLKKAAKGSPSRGVRFATSGGKVASTVMRSGRDASDERKKAAKKFAKKAGISDSFEYLLGEIFEDMIVEGYVDDYETASCVLESLTDDDFDYVCEAYSVVLNEATATPAERKQLNMGEGFDTFDAVLEYLYVEGYAETIEEAEAMMVNLTPEQIDKIVEAKKGDSYLETDMKKRQKNNEKAIKDMEKMGTSMKNPHFN